MPSKVLVPLQVGSLQVYQLLAPRFSSPSIVDTVQYLATYIDRDTTIQGERWFISAGGSINTNRGDGYYSWDKQAAKAALVYKFPASKGDMYNIQSTISGRDTLITRTVTETALPISVPTGSYLCHQYKTPLVPIDFRSFRPGIEINAAQDVGIVKTSYFGGNGSLIQSFELIAVYPAGEGAKRRIATRWAGTATETILGTVVTQALVDVSIQNEQSGALSGTGTYNPFPGTVFKPDIVSIAGTFSFPEVTLTVEEPRFRRKATIRGTLSSDMSRIDGTMTDGSYSTTPWKITLQRKR
jgi:hypothetical protein